MNLLQGHELPDGPLHLIGVMDSDVQVFQIPKFLIH